MSINVYLDVDGVLLSFSEILKKTEVRKDWIVSRECGGLAYKPSVVAAMNELADEPGVQMHWLTTWGGRAQTELCPAIGLKGQDWPVVGERHSLGSDNPWWKLQAIREHLGDGQALWIDDDISDDFDALNWLHENRNVRWMSPDTFTGLHDTHMRMALAWVTEAPIKPRVAAADHRPEREATAPRVTEPTQEASA